MRPTRPRFLQTVGALVGLALASACTDLATSPQPELRPPSAAALLDADVLILASTETTGRERSAITALGLTYYMASNAEWASLTAAQFANYRAVVLGDPNCLGGTGAVSAADANKNVWGPQIDGNVFIIGSDPSLHGKQEVMNKGIAFATSGAAGRTGAYITTSCYYHGVGLNTPVRFLDGLSTLGDFTARGVGCYNDAYKTADHPALTGLTSAYLSGWGCSIHNGFDGWPSDFEVLAIGRGIGAYYTAPDGTQGVPYILVRGEGLVVISDIALTPLSSTGEVGTTHTLTSTVEVDDAPLSGATVTFEVVDGPNAGLTGTGVTNAAGEATFSYSSAVVGTDGIRASFTDPAGVEQTSTRVTREWIPVSNVAPVADASATAGTVECAVDGCAEVTLDGSASSDSDGTIVSWMWTDADGNAVASGETATLVLGLGTHAFTLTVTDDDGAMDSAPVSVTVADATGPALAFNLTETTLGSPNHKLVAVGTIAASDLCDPSVELAFSVTSNEPLDGTGDGNTDSDWYFEPRADGSYVLWLRAERAGNGTDRVYTVTATASDASGNSVSQTGTVTVPKSQGKGE